MTSKAENVFINATTLCFYLQAFEREEMLHLNPNHESLPGMI